MKNILIVDDSKTITKRLEILIKSKLGYNPVIAHSKKECTEKLLKYKSKFAIALLDIGLPDAPNGEVIDLVTKFKIPSVVLTASTNLEDSFRNKDIVDYVIKDGDFVFSYIISLIKRIVANHNLKVLVVDDSKTFCGKIVDLLRRYRIDCFVANNGIEALDIIKKNKGIKLAFIDYYMPQMDGLELLREIRKEYPKDEFSTIIISGSSDRRTPAKFLKCGANDFLFKDFTEEEFYARLNSNLEVLELFEITKEKANKDYLTGLFNRRYLFEIGTEVYNRAKIKNNKLAVAIIDIDDFKKINDTYGHDIGDIAIKEVSRILKKTVNEDTITSRLGGEEFCLILKNRNKEEIEKLLNLIRLEFENNKIKISKKEKISYTVSIGYTVKFSENLESMLKFADEGLYKAKESGKNKVVYFED